MFDTETTIDPAQALTFGSWRFGYYASGGRLCILEEGLFYADNLPHSDPIGLRALREYAGSHPADVDRSSP
ncbi:MAG: hypothetical protein M3N46_04730, partial [Actinomycetota bacterium]|nr:hypothetical protein [Actinomycetota bacterium]